MTNIRMKRMLVGGLTLLGVLLSFGSRLSVAQASTGLHVKTENVLFIPAPVAQVIRVVDVLNLENNLQTPQDVAMTLPTGSEDVSIDGIKDPTQFIHQNQLTIPRFAKPGETNLTVSFKLPFQPQQGEQISLHTNYPVYTAKLYLPIGDMALSAEGLRPTTEILSISGTDYRVFTRLGIPSGDDWGMSIQMLPTATNSAPPAGLPVIGLSSSNTGNTLQAVGNLLVAAFVLGIGLISIRSTQWGRTARVAKTPEEALLHAWQNTEQQYQTGMLGEPEYQVLRQEYKRKLVFLRLKK